MPPKPRPSGRAHSRSASGGTPIRYDVSNVPSVHDKTTWPIFAQRNGTKSRERDADVEYRLYSADELGQFPPVDWLIPGWLAADELTGLFGPGDTYKSFIALTIGCQLAAAGRVVIYIAAEGMSGLKARVGAWKVHNGVPSLPTLLALGVNLNIHEPGARAVWRTEIETQLEARRLPGPELVVVDTLARNFVGGDENSAKDMGEFVEGVEEIRRHFGTAVVPLHHTTVDGRKERGTESLRNASFAMLKTDRRKLQRGSVQLECDRMKDAEPPKPVIVEFQTVALPWLGVRESRPMTSLAMKEPFPPAPAHMVQRSDMRAFVLDTLAIAGKPLSTKVILDRVRKRKIRIRQDRGGELLKAWAADPDIPIEHVRGKGYRRSEGRA